MPDDDFPDDWPDPEPEPFEESIIGEPIELFDPIVAGQQVENKTVVLELHLNRPGMYKRVSSDTLVESGIIKADDGTDETVDLKLLSISKRLIDGKDLKKLTKMIGKFLKEVKGKCAKSSMLNNAMYLLPMGMIPEVEEAVVRFETDLKDCLDEIELMYEDIQERQKIRLGPEFDSNDYPPFAAWRGAWQIRTMLWSFNVPAALHTIDRALFAREAEKSRLMWADTATEVREALRNETLAAIDYFAGITENDPITGKPQTFQVNRVEKLKAFFASIEARDLTNDSQTVEFAQQARQLLSGIDVKDLRKSKDIREHLSAAFSEIKEQAAQTLVVRERKFAKPIETVEENDEDIDFNF